MNLQASIDLNCVIVKEGGEYCVKSEDKSKNLGCKPSKGGAKKRLQQVEYFKHLKGGGAGSGRHKENLTHLRSDDVHKMNINKRKALIEKVNKSKAIVTYAVRKLLNKYDLYGGGPGSGRHKDAISSEDHKTIALYHTKEANRLSNLKKENLGLLHEYKVGLSRDHASAAMAHFKASERYLQYPKDVETNKFYSNFANEKSKKL